MNDKNKEKRRDDEIVRWRCILAAAASILYKGTLVRKGCLFEALSRLNESVK